MVDTTTLALQIVAAAAAAISAYSAYQMYRGNRLNRIAMERWSKTLVQPRIFIRSSDQSERIAFPRGPHGITENQVGMPGIFLENLGLGPALKGTLYVIDHENNKIPIRAPGSQYSFLRIPAGNRYHYPSYDSPELEAYLRNQTRIRIQVQYYDINDNVYSLPQAEEPVELQT